MIEVICKQNLRDILIPNNRYLLTKVDVIEKTHPYIIFNKESKYLVHLTEDGYESYFFTLDDYRDIQLNILLND